MSARDIFSMALRNLFKRKLRTLLTVLGVVIGTAAIVIMVSLGLGVNLSVQKTMESMGDVTMIQVYNWEGYYNQTPGAPVIDEKFIETIEKTDGVQTATPVMYLYLRTYTGRYYTEFQIMGVRPESMPYLGYAVKEGRLLEPGDDGFEIVMGSDLPFQYMTDRERNSGNRNNNWYYDSSVDQYADQTPNVDIFRDRIYITYDWSYGPTQNNSGEVKRAKPYKATVVGLLEKGDTYESSRYAFMNITTAKKIEADQRKWEQSQYGGRNNQQTYNGYERAIVKCTDIDKVEAVIAALNDMGFSDVYSPTQSVQSLREITGSLQALLGAIGIVSLFVAAIGITNTMIMAIYERTREIGIMKVIGAALKDIRKLFLSEAALIGLIGGAFGVGVSYIAAYILNNMDIAFLQMFDYSGEKTDISYIPPWLALSALGFSALIGLVSGYFPARRAMKLSALSAIRSE